jgi:hypothetical protein
VCDQQTGAEPHDDIARPMRQHNKKGRWTLWVLTWAADEHLLYTAVGMVPEATVAPRSVIISEC